MSEEYQSMLNKAVQNQSTISSDGRYTSPRTWGTYDHGTAAGQFRRFRFGNHPIRMVSLSVNMMFAMSWQPFTHGKKLMNLPRY